MGSERRQFEKNAGPESLGGDGGDSGRARGGKKKKGRFQMRHNGEIDFGVRVERNPRKRKT